MKLSSLFSRATVLAVAIYGANADAGTKNPPQQDYVTVDLTGAPNASGAYGPVRNSPGSTQAIQCVLYGDTTGLNVICSATDANGAQLACLTNASNITTAAKGLSTSSFLAFTTDGHGICNNMVVVNTSLDGPK